MAFTLSLYPWIYEASSAGGKEWKERFILQPHKSPAEEAALGEKEREALVESRNHLQSLPFISYTNQYGMGCFEGLKALPQKGGGYAVFRPEENGARMERSMTGLKMPAFPAALFTEAALEVVRRNVALGFRPDYDAVWEKDGYANASSIYIRPFAYAEGGIGVNLAKAPFVYIIATPVSSYFAGGGFRACTTEMVRATPKGTGWIKCDSNYVIPALAKHEAAAKGFMEVVFLDAKEGKYVEEGSSCNIFFLLKGGALVTPELGDTILPGITRKSVIELARDRGIKVEERRIAIEEAVAESKEVFVTGTAAGLTPIESITHAGREWRFTPAAAPMGELTRELLMTLKGIQYGALPDVKGWMRKV